MIPEMVLNQIQERLDIVELIADFVLLRRAGRNFKANCPFHEERTPSFVVNPDKQIFHCFGCGVGGNAFSFLMKFEKKDFREVVEMLAEKTGVEIPKDKAENPALQKRIAQSLEANRLALEFYHDFLLNKKEAHAARQYLESRGIREETVRDFKIGYAPESWDGLYLALKGRLPEEVLEKNGLVLSKKGGGFYDRFRARLIFPILDAKGACVAFGGRVLDHSLPKYLNSPESEIYSKGRNLYGLFQARKTIRENDSAVIVEGYMDLVACHQAGIVHVVASLGTALTEEQARIIRRNTPNATILYDADKAGELATLRGLELFLEQGLEVRVVRLPDGDDPDSYVQAHGAQALRDELHNAKSLFEFKLDFLKTKHDSSVVEGRVRIANEMVALLGKVRNEILRAAWLKELAGHLGLSEQALAAEMGKHRAGERASRFSPAITPAPVVESNAAPAAEKLILGLLFEGKDFLEEAKNQAGAEDFHSPVIRKIVQRLFESPAASVNRWINFFSEDAEAVKMISLACAETDHAADKKRAFSDCLLVMKRSRLRSEREGIRSQIIRAEHEGDRNRISQLLYDLNELNKREKQTHEKK